jgi:hypothetical protein
VVFLQEMKKSSFSEEKEAKRLLFLVLLDIGARVYNGLGAV